ncbi:MAG: hypothetical protein P8X81_01445 [Woeseiaceae bacterium]|jgi:hypothetical protein
MNDDTLILYYYNDGLSEDERRHVEAAIHSDAAVAARYDGLCRQLNGLADVDTPPVPAHTVQRWHDAIDREARLERGHVQQPRQRAFSGFSFAWGAAIAAVLVIGISLTMTGPDPVVEMPATTTSAFTRGVQVHFRDTYGQLASMPIEASADRTQLVLQIIEQNRLFERAAEQSDSDDLARVLRAFEPILVRLAAEDITPQEAAALRAQLTFELNVMLTKLSRDSSNETGTATTGIKT